MKLYQKQKHEHFNCISKSETDGDTDMLSVGGEHHRKVWFFFQERGRWIEIDLIGLEDSQNTHCTASLPRPAHGVNRRDLMQRDEV